MRQDAPYRPTSPTTGIVAEPKDGVTAILTVTCDKSTTAIANAKTRLVMSYSPRHGPHPMDRHSPLPAPPQNIKVLQQNFSKRSFWQTSNRKIDIWRQLSRSNSDFITA